MKQFTKKISVNELLGLKEPVEIAVEIFTQSDTPKTVLFCLPGGGCNRHYFDLKVANEAGAEGDESYSFAKTMVHEHVAVVLVDHMGVGESTRLDDGFKNTLEHIVAANAYVVETVCQTFASVERVIGVGHSMGALLAILQQDSYASFDAMALLGFGNGGMINHLGEFGQTLVGGFRTPKLHSIRLAQEQFGSGYFDIDPGPSRKESSVNPAAAESLTRARGSLITIPGSFSLVPGSVKKETARITVPVFIAVGERDICGPISEVASQFLQSVDFSCSDLKDTGHMHFVYGSRIKLFNDFKQWMAELN